MLYVRNESMQLPKSNLLSLRATESSELSVTSMPIMVISLKVGAKTKAYAAPHTLCSKLK